MKNEISFISWVLVQLSSDFQWLLACFSMTINIRHHSMRYLKEITDLYLGLMVTFLLMLYREAVTVSNDNLCKTCNPISFGDHGPFWKWWMVQFPVLCKFYEHYFFWLEITKKTKDVTYIFLFQVCIHWVLSLLVADNKRNDKCYIFLCDEMSVFLCLCKCCGLLWDGAP